jgi:hypothetical protein
MKSYTIYLSTGNDNIVVNVDWPDDVDPVRTFLICLFNTVFLTADHIYGELSDPRDGSVIIHKIMTPKVRPFAAGERFRI